ncbi:MAG: LysE family translocator [Rhodoferax sp.]|nr:LysE family translocator [Rhodoferax sp.]
MSTAEFTALLVLCTATSFTPGPNTTLSTALAANLGLRKALRFVTAVPVGWGLLFSLCAGGLGALVVALPWLHNGIQFAGVGYLLWLASKLARSGTLTQARPEQLQVSFLQGVLLQFLNIKAWMLALTVVAGWMAGHADALDRFFVLLPVMLAFGFSSNLLYAAIGSLLREWLAGPYIHGVGSALRLRWFNRFMAAVLVVTAGWMAIL